MGAVNEVGVLEVNSTMFVMDENGDTRLQWNRKNPEEVDAARARFNQLKHRGYLAYKVDASGRQGEVLDAFDPNEQRIIMAPQMVGG